MESNEHNISEINIGSVFDEAGCTIKCPAPAERSQQSRSGEGHFVRHLSSTEYAAVICMIVASLYLILSSFFPLIYNFTSAFDPIDFIKNLFYLIIGMGTLSGVSFLLRKETHLEHLADEAFDKVIYHRLEPVLMDVAEVQVGLTGMQTQLDRLNMNVEILSKKETIAAPAVATQTASHVKYIVLINLTLAVFLFMLQFPLGYVPYAVTMVYLLWWGAITADFKLWKDDATWGWIFVPVLVLPIYTMAMNSYLQSYMLFASLFIGLGLYTFFYYSWCNYVIKGTLPFDIQEAVRSAQVKIEAAKQVPEFGLHNPQITLNLKMPSRVQIGWNMILFAVALFFITWTGYAIQHGIIPNISWDMLGLNDFTWSSSFTYLLNFLGLILILYGLRYIKKPQI